MKRKITCSALIAYIEIIFMLFSFAVIDFSIPPKAVFISLIATVLFLGLIAQSFDFTDIFVAFFFLGLMVLFFVLWPNASRDRMTIYLVSLWTAIIFVFFAKPNEEDMLLIIKIIIVMSFCLSIYTIVIKLFPGFFYSVIRPRINTNSGNVADKMIQYGYGVSIGANPTLSNHINGLGIITITNTVIFQRKSRLNKLLFVLLLQFTAVIIMNRKGELFATILVLILCLYGNRNNYSRETRTRIRKTIKYVLLFGVIILVLSIRQGWLERYQAFFAALFNNQSAKTDITTGRKALWTVAWSLFKDNPIFGIGWGNFADNIHIFNPLQGEYLRNAHSLVIQLLCEVGIVGCTLYMLPVFYILGRTISVSRILKKRKEKSETAEIVVNISLYYQIFLLINGLLDSTWHRTYFWWFYAAAVIFLNSAIHITAHAPTLHKQHRLIQL